MTDNGHECYLCGAQNEPTASFCSRCNGQLLSLGNEPAPAAAAPEPEPEISEVAATKGDEKTGRFSQLRRKSTLDDSRLSDALGLNNDSVAEATNTQVTAVPKAKGASDIPLIGTRPGLSTSRSLRDEDPGRRVLVLLGALLLATAWLGWTTLRSNGPVQPSVASATPTTTTTTSSTTPTTAPVIEWNESEAQGQFGDTLVLVQLISCVGEGVTAETSGINIDEHTTLIDTAPLPTARSARIFTRTGASRVAVITTKSTGATVAVSPTRTTDHADISTNPIGEPRFQLEFDQAENRVSITRISSDADFSGDQAQLLVNSQGDASAAGVGGRTFTQEQLADSLDTVTPIEGADGSADDPCTWPAALAFASGNTSTTPTSIEETSGEGSDESEEASQ